VRQPKYKIAALACLWFAGLWAAPNYDRIQELAQQRYGQRGLQAMQSWRDQVNALRRSSEDEQVKRVNEFVNKRIFFNDDLSVWGEKEYWATPLESLGRGAGDCEDFAIAKYISLRLLGVSNDKLRMSYVKARIGGPNSKITEAHMVLGYYPTPTSEPFILDNLIGELRPASSRSDLTPVFSFNSEGIWTGTAPSASPAGSATARLSRWRDVIARLQNEGFE
jgi:predicted transglutaminase-like cysteine proteinase